MSSPERKQSRCNSKSLNILFNFKILADNYTQEFLKSLRPYSQNSKYGKYFASVKKDEKVCIVSANGQICGQTVGSKSYSTNGMLHHLKNAHKLDEAVINPSNTLIKHQPSLEQYSASIFERCDLSFTIARLICSDLISINCIASSKAFKTLFKKAFGANLSRHLLWNKVLEVEKVLKSHLIEQMEGKKVNISVDDWTSRQSIGFCNINASYIKDGEYTNHCLGLIRLSSTDGKSLAINIKTRLDEFEMKPKFITTDGASNMATMSKHGGFLQQKCMIHGLQLVVFELIFLKRDITTGLPVLEFECDDSMENDELVDEDSGEEDEIDEAVPNLDEVEVKVEIFTEQGLVQPKYMLSIKKVRSLMVSLKRSTKQREALKKYTSLSPLLDVCTRWNSTLIMLNRFIRLKDSLEKAKYDNTDIKKKMCFEDDEIIAINLITNVLEPFNVATKSLSAEGVNLHMADIILEILIGQIENQKLKNRTIERIMQRREIWSDMLLYLKNDTESISFYTEPNDIDIINLYNRVISFYKKICSWNKPINKHEAITTLLI